MTPQPIRFTPQPIRLAPWHRRAWSVFLAGFWLLAVPLAAQPGEPPAFSEILDVHLVEIDVVVTGRGGEPVNGLLAEDFVLRVDGEPRPVGFFNEVAGGLTVAAAGETAVAAGEPAATRYLVFIDDYFAVPSHRDRVLIEMRQQLDRLAPHDEMAIVAYDGRHIEVLAGWTSSRTRLAAALEAATRRTAYGLRRMSEQSRTGSWDGLAHGDELRGLRTGPRASFSSIGFRGSLREEADAPRGDEVGLRQQMEQLARAAASALRGFATPRPGMRRVALLLAGGWPAASFERVGGTPARALTSQIRFRPFASLVETANRLGYTLYPVDLYAAGTSPGHDVEVGTLEGSRRAAAWQERHVAEGRDVLVHLAGATGGRALLGAARLVALEQVSADQRSYYRLGFTPEWRGDGDEHRVVVQMRRPGLAARHRNSYTDTAAGSEIELMIEGAQLFDLPLSGDGELTVSLGPPRRVERRDLVIDATVTIPLDELAWLPAGETWTAEVELRIAARDERGDVAEVPVVPLTLERTSPPGAGDVVSRNLELQLRSLDHDLLFVLYDPTSRELWSKRLEFKP